MSDMIGQRLGQYELIATLGQGGMATVYRARQLNVKREVAIKVIKANLAQTEDFIKRFEREAQTIASLSHPHILKLFDYGEHAGTIYLVTELLAGGSLSDVLRQRHLTLETVEQLLDQIAAALNYAHQRDIVHRDLKPQNVFVDENGHAFLADFGIARLMSDSSGLTQEGAAMDTPAYMSPEQWRGEPAGLPADIYALGII